MHVPSGRSAGSSSNTRRRVLEWTPSAMSSPFKAALASVIEPHANPSALSSTRAMRSPDRYSARSAVSSTRIWASSPHEISTPRWRRPCRRWRPQRTLGRERRVELHSLLAGRRAADAHLDGPAMPEREIRACCCTCQPSGRLVVIRSKCARRDVPRPSRFDTRGPRYHETTWHRIAHAEV
jgi:hypothetical protein